MEIFNELENSYYDCCEDIILDKKQVNSNDIRSIIRRYTGEVSRENFINYLLNSESNPIVYKVDKDSYNILPDKFEILPSTVHLDAFYSLIESKENLCNIFLDDNTIDKLKSIQKPLNSFIDFNNIDIKKQYKNGDTSCVNSCSEKVKLVFNAIKNNKKIICDNIPYEKNIYSDQEILPYKIEYSMLNDKFRVYAYSVLESRFIKMNIDRLDNIRISEESFDKEKIEMEFKNFMIQNKETLIINVKPVNNVIERCFRIFSYYDRETEFNPEDNTFVMKIHFYSFDRSELIRDLLSLGEGVTVIEPADIREKIIARVKKCISPDNETLKLIEQLKNGNL